MFVIVLLVVHVIDSLFIILRVGIGLICRLSHSISLSMCLSLSRSLSRCCCICLSLINSGRIDVSFRSRSLIRISLITCVGLNINSGITPVFVLFVSVVSLVVVSVLLFVLLE